MFICDQKMTVTTVDLQTCLFCLKEDTVDSFVAVKKLFIQGKSRVY